MNSKQELYFEMLKKNKVKSNSSVQWKNFGPAMSGYCERFWCHPSNPDVMFMGPDMHVSFGTWDRGESWQTIKDCDGLGKELKRILHIEFSVQNPDFALALDWNGWVYETIDCGHTWNKISEIGNSWKTLTDDPQGNDNEWYYDQEGTRHDALAVDPSDDRIWYVGAGNFWDVKAIHKNQENPYGKHFKYAAYGYIAKSQDRGKTWSKYTQGLPKDADIGKIIINPKNSQHIIMVTSHGLFHSFDGGICWESKSSGLPNNLPRDMTSFYNQETGKFTLYLLEQTVYTAYGDSVTSKGGLYKSVDDGFTWTDISGNLAFDLSRIHDETLVAKYYRTISFWFGITEEEAVQKYPVLPRSIMPVYNFLAVNPLDENEIYVSPNKKHDVTFGPAEVWHTMDGGKNYVMCARYGRYWLSNIDDAYWKSVGQPVGTNMKFAHLQPYMDYALEPSGNRFVKFNAEGEVYIQVDQQTLISKNHGMQWEQTDDIETTPGSGKWISRGGSNLPGRFILHETGIKERRLLCSGEHGLWQTTLDDTWENTQDVIVEQIEGQIRGETGAHSISTVAVHPYNPDIIYILMWRQEHRGMLRRSLDGGKTWENISKILDCDRPIHKECACQYSLMIDPENPDNMYFCSIYLRFTDIQVGASNKLTQGEYGFYRSSDGGYTWEPANEGLSHEGFSVRRIAMDPQNPIRLYAALNDDEGGLFVTDNRGDTWTKVKLPSEIVQVNNVFINKMNNEILIATGRPNGSYEEGGVYKSTDSGTTWEKIFKAPYVWQAVSSVVDPNIILLSAAGQYNIAFEEVGFINPGVYISQDGGESFDKINQGLGQPDKIVELSLDPYNKNVVWCSSWGCGWFVAYLNASKDAWI
ncbi:MAG: hypothetical protein R3Y47_08995 [Lachnospiraceae bacterium]